MKIWAMKEWKPRFRISQAEVQLSAARPVRIQDVAAQHDFPPHDHEFAELCLVWGGSGWHRTQEGAEPLRKGSMIVVMPGQVHAFEGNRRLATTNIYYLSDWLLADLRAFRDGENLWPLFLYQSVFARAAWKRIPLFQLNDEELRDTRRDLGDLQRELTRPAPSTFYLRATFLRFLYRAGRAFARADGFVLPKKPSEIEHLLEAVEVSLGERRPFRVSAACREAGFSRRHLTRLFQSHTGGTLSGYYRRRRVQLASHLLLDPSRTITEIAHELGFADNAHFSRVFRSLKKMPPRGYRRLFLGKGKL